MIYNLLKKFLPGSGKEIRVVRERRNNTLTLFADEGGPSNSDEVIKLPNYKYFMELYPEGTFKPKYREEDGIEMDRAQIIWRNPEAFKENPKFFEDKKNKPKEFGTIFDSIETAKKVIEENEFFKYYARDFRVMAYPLSKKKDPEEIGFSPEDFIPPPTNFAPNHVETEEDMANLEEVEAIETE